MAVNSNEGSANVPSECSPVTTPGAVQKMAESSLVTVLLTATLLFAAAIYLIPPLWNKNFGLYDDRYFYGPNAYFLDTSLNNGEFPFWNPLIYTGTPFSADPQSSVFYPPHLLRSLLTPAYNPYATAVSLQITLALHLLLGALGVYVLAREYRLSPPAGFVAALVFMLGPFSIENSTEFYIFPLVMAWAPWLLWLAKRALHAESALDFLRYCAWATLCFGISTLVFFPQLSLYMGLMLLFFVLLDGLLHPPRSGSNGALRSAGRTLARGAFLLASVALLGALIAAVALLPAAEFSDHSARTVIAGLVVESWPQNLDWFHLLKCLVVFPGNTWLPQGCRAAGIGSLLALLAAFTHKNRRDALVFIGMFVLMTDLTLGPPFPMGRLLQSIDFLNITVSPWRAGIFSSLCLAMAVAFGIDAASQASRSTLRALLRTGIYLVSGVGMILLLRHWLKSEALYTPIFPAWIMPVLILAALCVFTWVNRPRWAKATIAVLVAAEIISWSAQMLPEYVSRRVDWKTTTNFGGTGQIWPDNFRTAAARPNWNMWSLDAATNGYDAIYIGRTRQILCRPSLETTYRATLREDEVQSSNQRGNLFLKRSFWLARQWVPGALPGKDQLYPAATTVFLPEVESGTRLPVPEAARSDVENQAISPDLERIDVNSRVDVQRMTRKIQGDEVTLTLPPFQTAFTHSVLYIGYTATNAVNIRPLCTDETGAQYKLYDQRASATYGGEELLAIALPDCETATVTLQWPAKHKKRLTLTQAYVLKDLADENERIKILHRSANAVDVETTELPEARILAFIDSAYPGWRARIDGEEASIMLANDGYKAIVVPAGTHRIRFWFEPRSTAVGFGISSVTLALLIAAIALLSLLAKRQSRLVNGQAT